MQQELRWGQDAQLPRSGLPVLRHTLAAADGGAQRQCRIIQGPVALSAQLVLLIIVMTALTIKRYVSGAGLGPEGGSRKLRLAPRSLAAASGLQ